MAGSINKYIHLDVWESRRKQSRPTPSGWNYIFIYLDVWEFRRKQSRPSPSGWNYIFTCWSTGVSSEDSSL